MRRLLSFAVVGGIGFLVDAGVLLALMRFAHLDAFSARLIAIGCAISCTWMLNRSFTFSRSRHSLAAEGARYWSVGLSTCAVNYGVYSLLILTDPHFVPLLALVISSGCAMVFSYTGYSHFVFGWRSPSRSGPRA